MNLISNIISFPFKIFFLFKILIEAGNGGGGIITTPLASGILPLRESRPNHPLRCGGAGDPEGVTTEMQGHSETGKGNN